jgi:hypothetical protein
VVHRWQQWSRLTLLQHYFEVFVVTMWWNMRQTDKRKCHNVFLAQAKA